MRTFHIQPPGFPIKLPHAELCDRLHPLLNLAAASADGGAAAGDTPPLQQLLMVEAEAAAVALPSASHERSAYGAGAAAFAVGHTKTFLREFLYLHLLARRDALRERAARSLQRRARRRLALRLAARRRLTEEMQGSQLPPLQRLLAAARRLGVHAALLEEAEQVAADLGAATRHAHALAAAERLGGHRSARRRGAPAEPPTRRRKRSPPRPW